MILAVTLFVALAAASGAATYLFFGHYWHVLLTRRADDE
jgi:hypothetical protein